MLVNEFGTSPAQKDWRQRLERGRSRYRITQLQTAASDDLEAVADLLESRGHQFAKRPSPPPARRMDRLAAY